MEGLRKLFAAGNASPFEVDREGRTPLHVRTQLMTLDDIVLTNIQYAAMYARSGACRFLLAHGADANVRTSWHGTFPTSISKRNANIVRRACSRYIRGSFHDTAAYS